VPHNVSSRGKKEDSLNIGNIGYLVKIKSKLINLNKNQPEIYKNSLTKKRDSRFNKKKDEINNVAKK
jgi:hypothetical protein